ncbi:EF-P lysine aminoacylase GenX [Marinobacter vulgaris]|uniref:EF-P lysine aminoacylase GenX n=1 Tax=Marinobacter vulgaris TaxID=1928331 RepID=A0A2V3ZWB3_9GAMM|nr:EF-P lysine aminoacylase EpmA [Marinobacter vulgaris]PXX89752.1 EF-P lysine aminoacylase GenX [Marinobacter vulgaris]TSJ68744.1 EF-P lysine aminoacylase GenX [Marinobacter vulgaris]
MTETPSWQPSASLAALESRAQQLAWVRDFFAQRGVMEVETPVLGRCGVTDINIDSIAASPTPVGSSPSRAWLQTSPEYHMKRLLAAGVGSIYQVARVFRDGESGRRHNPEFSLLEWYRPGFTDSDLMAEVAELVCGWLGCEAPTTISYRDVFLRFAGVDPFLSSDTELSARCEQWMEPSRLQAFSRDDCLDLLMSCQVEPALAEAGPVFVTGYPESQAALARVSEQDGLRQAHRFELYVQGVELCNGYWELTDPGEQRQRFAADNRARVSAGKPEMPVDQAFLAALQAGVPDCAGVALGLDRLLMLKMGVDDLASVIAFPAERA